MACTHGCFFVCVGLGGNSTLAVKAGTATVAMRYRVVYISVVYYCNVYVGNRSIIPVMAAFPPAAVKAAAAIATSVIYTTVKAHGFAPVSAVPAVIAAVIAPIAGCP